MYTVNGLTFTVYIMIDYNLYIEMKKGGFDKSFSCYKNSK